MNRRWRMDVSNGGRDMTVVLTRTTKHHSHSNHIAASAVSMHRGGAAVKVVASKAVAVVKKHYGAFSSLAGLWVGVFLFSLLFFFRVNKFRRNRIPTPQRNGEPHSAEHGKETSKEMCIF